MVDGFVFAFESSRDDLKIVYGHNANKSNSCKNAIQPIGRDFYRTRTIAAGDGDSLDVPEANAHKSHADYRAEEIKFPRPSL